MIKLYGIPNCDTIKKARKWLTDNDLEYEFHDYKKQGVPEKDLNKWIKQASWEQLLNKRSTTWRKLDDSIKASVDEESAIKIILHNPGIIKRPVLVKNKTLLIGFSASEYASLL